MSDSGGRGAPEWAILAARRARMGDSGGKARQNDRFWRQVAPEWAILGARREGRGIKAPLRSVRASRKNRPAVAD
jgi:hypothetical protein